MKIDLGKTEPVYIGIPADVVELIDSVASAEQCTRSALLRGMVNTGLDLWFGGWNIELEMDSQAMLSLLSISLDITPQELNQLIIGLSIDSLKQNHTLEQIESYLADCLQRYAKHPDDEVD